MSAHQKYHGLALKKKQKNLSNTWFPVSIWFTVSSMVFPRVE
jgi:hypothetical protein